MKNSLISFLCLALISSCTKEENVNQDPEVVQIPEYSVSITSGEGGNVSTSGGTFKKDSEISVTATPNAEYLFQAWSDGSTDNPRTLKIAADITITANFVKKQYDLTVNVIGEGAVSEEIVIQGGRYNSGSQVKVTATPAEGWEFSSWSGAANSTENPLLITINEGKELTATFIPKKHDLTIITEGEGTVSEELIVQQGQYERGSILKLTALPSDGWEFSGWSGEIESLNNPISFELNNDISIKATFTKILSQTSNGIIVASENAVVGKTYPFLGSEYLIVDNDLLRSIATDYNNNDLSLVVTSKVTDMSFLFSENNYTLSSSYTGTGVFANFNHDISSWDVSNVTTMRYMFKNSGFNGDLSNWDVSNVEDFSGMFANTIFNSDISKWNTSRAWVMHNMFWGSEFNQDISNWDVSNVSLMTGMFSDSQFNMDISLWDVSNVQDMRWMFRNSIFTGDISNWDVSHTHSFFQMFKGSKFNGDISKWSTILVIDSWQGMEGMFEDSIFNQDISSWCVANIKTEPADFSKNSNLDNRYKPIWGTCNNEYDISIYPIYIDENGIVKARMDRIVAHRYFAIDGVDYFVVSSENIRDIVNNQSIDLTKLVTSVVTNMAGLFKNSDYNGDISSWDVSNVTTMFEMFKDASDFNQDLSNWETDKVSNCEDFAVGALNWSKPKPEFNNCTLN